MPQSSRGGRRIAFAVVASLALHFAFLPFAHVSQARAEPPPRPDIIEIRPPAAIVTPRPTPRPTPAPAPTPRVVPVTAHAPPRARPEPLPLRHVRVDVPRAVAIASGAPEASRAPRETGGANGVPGDPAPVEGSGAGRPGSAPLPAQTAPPAPATEEPLATAPACAKPDVAAHVITAVEPEIPDSARERGEATGVVNVRVDLSESGSVTNVSVAKSAGNAALDAAALDAARHSTYAAALADCRPEGGTYLFRVEFDG